MITTELGVYERDGEFASFCGNKDRQILTKRVKMKEQRDKLERKPLLTCGRQKPEDAKQKIKPQDHDGMTKAGSLFFLHFILMFPPFRLFPI